EGAIADPLRAEALRVDRHDREDDAEPDQVDEDREKDDAETRAGASHQVARNAARRGPGIGATIYAAPDRSAVHRHLAPPRRQSRRVVALLQEEEAPVPVPC